MKRKTAFLPLAFPILLLAATLFTAASPFAAAAEEAPLTEEPLLTAKQPLIAEPPLVSDGVSGKGAEENQSSGYSPAFRVALDAERNGETVTLTVRVEDRSEGSPLTGILFDVRYDAGALRLVSDRHEDGTLDCVVRSPGEKWQNLTTSEEDGLIRVALALTEASEQRASGDGGAEFRFAFRTQGNPLRSTEIVVPSDTAVALDADFSPLSGEGAVYTLVLTDEKTDQSVSSGAKEIPATGDPGVRFALLLFCGCLLGMYTAYRVRKRKPR